VTEEALNAAREAQRVGEAAGHKLSSWFDAEVFGAEHPTKPAIECLRCCASAAIVSEDGVTIRTSDFDQPCAGAAGRAKKIWERTPK
jgi:hypothetical protein